MVKCGKLKASKLCSSNQKNSKEFADNYKKYTITMRSISLKNETVGSTGRVCRIQWKKIYCESKTCQKNKRIGMYFSVCRFFQNCVCFKVDGKNGYEFFQDIFMVSITRRDFMELLNMEIFNNCSCKGMSNGAPIFCYWLYVVIKMIDC
ncbi:hypothetical protein VP01_523g10 [Puccinia sorghi]|uniref:Uncharacterized protein n=1 Tax=Puccinia sorghi TaxID=27349 RepID=A0A0L6UMI7_9BASI|nr:hypothetical protein VP01_523g10 [Puccinia sorghi]